MDLIEYVMVGLSPNVRMVFDAADEDGSGTLDYNECRLVVTQIQKGELNLTTYRRMFETVCRADDARITYWEFVRLYLLTDNDEMQRKRRYYRLYASTVTVVLWLIFGMLVFNATEQWGGDDSKGQEKGRGEGVRA